jgi:hypothetical protein
MPPTLLTPLGSGVRKGAAAGVVWAAGRARVVQAVHSGSARIGSTPEDEATYGLGADGGGDPAAAARLALTSAVVLHHATCVL